MRNKEMMIALLKEMAEDSEGRILIFEADERFHQAELLEDAGLARWRHKAVLRITNRGYELHNALDQDPSNPGKFLTWLSQGVSIVSAVKKIVELTSKATET